MAAQGECGQRKIHMPTLDNPLRIAVRCSAVVSALQKSIRVSPGHSARMSPFLLSFFLPAAHRCVAGDLPFNSAQVVSQEVFECHLVTSSPVPPPADEWDFVCSNRPSRIAAIFQLAVLTAGTGAWASRTHPHVREVIKSERE
ncbi:MAG: hypothetical protein WBE76_00540 [Terracidiphilus sp.]